MASAVGVSAASPPTCDTTGTKPSATADTLTSRLPANGGRGGIFSEDTTAASLYPAVASTNDSVATCVTSASGGTRPSAKLLAFGAGGGVADSTTSVAVPLTPPPRCLDQPAPGLYCEDSPLSRR